MYPGFVAEARSVWEHAPPAFIWWSLLTDVACFSETPRLLTAFSFLSGRVILFELNGLIWRTSR